MTPLPARIFLATLFFIAAFVWFSNTNYDDAMGRFLGLYSRSDFRGTFVLEPWSFWRLFGQNFLTALFVITAIALLFRARWSFMLVRIMATLFAIQMNVFIVMMSVGGVQGLMTRPWTQSLTRLDSYVTTNPIFVFFTVFSVALMFIAWLPIYRPFRDPVGFEVAVSMTIIFAVFYIHLPYHSVDHIIRGWEHMESGRTKMAIFYFTNPIFFALHGLYGCTLIGIALCMIQRNRRAIEMLNVAIALYVFIALAVNAEHVLLRTTIFFDVITDPSLLPEQFDWIADLIRYIHLAPILYFTAMQVYLRGPYKRIAAQ